MTTTLSFGFSPCPNDTFAFHALAHGLVDEPLVVEPAMDDIESLNRRAHDGDLQLTKLSFGALSQLQHLYVPLRSGAALGRGAGPLLVARPGTTLEQALAGSIAIPGYDTTAYLLLQMVHGPGLSTIVELRYDEILSAVQRGDVDAGLIIHESRFTYAERGLHQIGDLGRWWEQQSGMPLPLAVICARSDVTLEQRALAERALRASVQHAMDDPTASAEFVRAHAQELAPDVCRRHIDLYVNDFTLDVGLEGIRAIDLLLERSHRKSTESDLAPDTA